MKVDLVIGTLEVGGAERQVVGLASEMRRQGVDVHVVTLAGGGVLAQQLEAAGVPVISLQCRPLLSHQVGRILRGVVAGRRLAAHWRQRRPTAMQSWLTDVHITALPIARREGVPVRVMAVRSQVRAVRMSQSRRLALRAAARCSTCVISNTSEALEHPGWPIAGIPWHVVPNAVEIPHATADASREPAVGVMLANFLPYKGHDVLIRAMARMSQPPRMRLLGTGVTRDRVVALARALGVIDFIEIFEGVSDPWPVLLDSQFAVLPSLTEGMPNAVLEAMAAGLPVVASDVGAITKLIGTGVGGKLVRPGDVEGLAHALESAMHDPDWRRESGTRGRRCAAEFTWRAMAERNLDIMRAALAESRQ